MDAALDNDDEIDSCRDIIIALVKSWSGDDKAEYGSITEDRIQQLQLCNQLFKCMERRRQKKFNVNEESSSVATSEPSIREVFGNLPASYISKLPLLLAELLTDRIETTDVLTISHDESAATDAMFSSTSAVTISSLAMISGTIYATISGIPGGLAYGLIHVGALSGLSALIRRWTVECRGREPGVRDDCRVGKRRITTAIRNKKVVKKKIVDTGSKKRKRQPGTRRSTRLLASTESSDEEEISLNETAMQTIHEEYQTESPETVILSHTSEKDPKPEENLVSDGLRLVKALSRALLIPEFRSWSIEARETLIDAVSSGIACFSALSVSGCDGSDIKHDIEQISRGMILCVETNAQSKLSKPSPPSAHEAETSTVDDEDDEDDEEKSNIVFVLRGLFPVLSFQLELPNGQRGKQAAFDVAVRTFQGIAAAASALVVKKTQILSAGLSSSSKSENFSTKKRGLLSARRFSLTPSSRKSFIDTPNHRPVIHSNSLVPSLNKAVTPKTIRFERLHTNSRSDEPLVRPSGVLGSIVGLLQKLSTSNDLNKADFRHRVSSLIQSSLAVLPAPERLHFLRFTYHLSYSRRASHRVLAVEMIGRVLSEDWLWLYHCTNEPISFIHAAKSNQNLCIDDQLMMQSSVWIGSAGSLDSGSCPPLALFAALHGRMSDVALVVRTKAIHSISALIALTRNTEFESASLSYMSHRSLASTLEAQADILKKSLLKRATMDERATVRTASVVGLKNLLLMECDISRQDIDALTQLCSDVSILVRKTAAESISSLLIECSARGACGSMLELLEESWASRVLLQAADEETNCAASAVKMFMQVIFEPIASMNENCSSVEHYRRYVSAWRILARSAGHGVGSSTAIHGGLRIALLKVFQSYGNFSTNHKCINFLQEMRAVSLKTLDLHCLENNSAEKPVGLTFSSQEDTDSLRRGVWCAFDALRECLRTTTELRQNAEQHALSFAEAMATASVNGDLFLTCWNKLKDLLMGSSSLNNYHFSIVACCRSCLLMISHFESKISIDLSLQARNGLQEMLSSQALPADVISCAIQAVLSLMKGVSSHSALSEDSIRAACAGWLNDLLSSCSSLLDSFFSVKPTWMERDSEFSVKLERALISIGEVVLVGFSNDEAGAPATSEILGVKESFLNDPICGLHMKPSQLLLERIVALIPYSLPSLEGEDAVITPPNIRAISIVTLGKISLRDESLAKGCLNLLLHELHNQEDEHGKKNSIVQSNALLVLGDLCVRYTNIVDRHLTSMASCLQAGARSDFDDKADEFEIVRMHAVMTLSTLLLQDFIKWRGLLFHRFLAAAVDASDKVAQIAKAVLCGPLLNKQPNLFHNNFVEAIFVLNGCLAHPISKAAIDLGDIRAGVSVEFNEINLSGSQNRSKRHQIYSMMLEHLTDEHKIGVTARLAKEVFGSALNGGDLNVACKLSTEALFGNSDSISSSERRRIQCAFNVVKDTFSVLTSPLCQVGRDRCTDELEEGEESNFSGTGFPDLHLAVVKGRLLTTISSKQTVQVIVPILCNMKGLLEDSQSELLQDLMLYLVYIYRRYKEEVKEVLSSDSILLQEIDFDTRQFERLKRESQALSGKARAAPPVTPHPIFHL